MKSSYAVEYCIAATPISLRLELQLIFLAAFLAAFSAGSRSETRIAMTETVIRSSMRVNYCVFILQFFLYYAWI